MNTRHSALRRIAHAAFGVILLAAFARAAPEDSAEAETGDMDVLPAEQWARVDEANRRALDWLRTQQQPDGSFTTIDTAQPAVTSLATLAFLAAGRQPGKGDDGAALEKACRYIISCQRDDGLLALVAPNGPCESFNSSHTSNYNHAIAGICLGELSGSVTPELNADVMKAIEKALTFTLDNQKRVLRFPDDRGGWRYATPNYNVDSDVLVTAWHIMFLRSAKNAGFPVPQKAVDDAYDYVLRCYNPGEGTFTYGLRGHEAAQISTSITGAAVLSFTLAGKGDEPAIKSAGEWLLAHPIAGYRQPDGRPDAPYFYGVFYGSQASFQLGGDTWRRYYPPVVSQLVDNQLADGSWEVETDRGQMAGRVYTTALAVLTLTISDQLLPIYQR
jgi:hypothetical protein